MHTQKHSLDFIQSQLTFLPQDTVHKILKHIRQTIKYEPVIGIMGKSGSGKSSLCNALFQSEIRNTHPLEGCTRDAQRLTLTIKERLMTIIDHTGGRRNTRIRSIIPLYLSPAIAGTRLCPLT